MRKRLIAVNPTNHQRFQSLGIVLDHHHNYDNEPDIHHTTPPTPHHATPRHGSPRHTTPHRTAPHRTTPHTLRHEEGPRTG